MSWRVVAAIFRERSIDPPSPVFGDERLAAEARLHFWIAFKSNGQSDDPTPWNRSVEGFATVRDQL